MAHRAVATEIARKRNMTVAAAEPSPNERLDLDCRPFWDLQWREVADGLVR
jgi:hypothetical protein